MKRVRGISVEGGVSITLGKEKPSILSLLKALEDWAADERFTLPVVLDEAQELRFFRGGRRRTDFRKTLAYCYDNFENTSFILSGSETGLLYSFLGIDDPRSPLYGRHHVAVQLEKLDRESSTEFLIRGFEYHGVKPSKEFLEEAVEFFDGIIGCLAYFGAEAVMLHKTKGALSYEVVLKTVKARAIRLCAEELEKLASRSRLYLGILATLGKEGRTWSEISLALEKLFRRTVSDPQLAALLQNLIKLSYIQKVDGRYRVLDPLTAEVAAMLLKKSTQKP